MLDGGTLDEIVKKHKPYIIVPEIEAIRTERLYDYEKSGIQVVSCAKAANYTTDRKAIRDLAAIEVGVKTAPFCYADSFDELKKRVLFSGMLFVFKPLIFSSVKGQSVIKTEADISKAWDYVMSGSRGDKMEVIVESFIDFDCEITLLTLTQINGATFSAHQLVTDKSEETTKKVGSQCL